MTDKQKTNGLNLNQGTHNIDEERYRDFIHISSAAVWELGVSGLYTYVTENIESFTGYRPEEIVGGSAYELMVPNDIEAMRELFKNIWRTREPFKNIIYRISGKSGNELYIETNGLPIFDDKREFIGYRGTCQDVSERQKTLEALRYAHDELNQRGETQSRNLDEEANRYRLLNKVLGEADATFSQSLKDAKQWYWETDESHKLSVLSGGWGEFASERLDWFMGKRIEEVVHRRMSPDAWDQINDLMAQHKPIKGVVFKEKKLGGESCHIRLSASPRYGESGKFIGYRGWCVDVTEEMEAVYHAEGQKKRLIAAIDQMEDEIILFDSEDKFVACNNSFYHHFTTTEGAMKPGATFEELLRISLQSGKVKAAIGREEAWLAERLERHRQGLSLPPMKSIDGRWHQAKEYNTSDGGTLIVRRDITKERERENDLFQAKDNAELANRAKSEFLANMSHELRTPLNAIIGFSDVMVHEMFGPVGVETYKEYHQAIRDSGHHLLELINDILDLSRIEAGVIELEEVDVNVKDMVTRCLRLFEEKAKVKGVALVSKLPTSFSYINGDPRRLRQILINLISNSLKFTPKGGSVTLDIYEEKNQAIFSVTDTGIGIDEADHGKAFQTFTQLQKTHTKNNEGTGLGLPLTRSLVELHDGTIQMISALGKGTRVIVTLPDKRIIR